ncbi:uncharacterized protein ISCGN_029337 [Ixodes scapularis]
MSRDENIPFAFDADHWVRHPPDRTNLTQDRVWNYLKKDSSLRQAHRGWSFKEEGYVRHVMWNWSKDSNMCLVRAVVLPSMKKVPYTATAWFNRETGVIEGGKCECVAGRSQSCQHVAAVLLSAEESCSKNQTSCTDVPCAWIVPSEAKKPAALMPLTDLTFRKFVINKPGSVKRKRSFDPCQSVSLASSSSASRNLERLKARLTAAAPDMLWLRYAGGACQAVPPRPPLPICDDEDLWATSASDTVQAHMASLPVLSCQERGQITADTVGQADNLRWHKERVGRVTASQFAAAVRCKKPDYLLKRMLYPKPGAVSEAMAYGREHEPDAVASYVQLLTLADIEVEVRETGLHLHPQYNFIGASPDRIVTVAGDEGLLEVKCPLSQKGKTVLEAAKLKNFCCEVVGLEVRLKRKHPYFFQVQGQMAVTGHKWCHFVIWTEDLEDTESKGMTHIETIDFDESSLMKKYYQGFCTSLNTPFSQKC